MVLSLNEKDFDLRPTKIVAVARNYRAHAQEMKAELPKEPKFFLKPPSSLLADNGQVILPKLSARVDYEVELAVVMKERVKIWIPGDVKEKILGYTILVDVTARDIQAKAKQNGMPWTIAKGFDTFAPIGPRIVLATDIDPQNLDIWLKVNGAYKQRGNTSQMIFSVEKLVSSISSVMTLEPMDVIATGTPSGVGPMNDGDVVEAGVEGIGVLSFKVVRER
jgi:2-keto-4-pentenoate hydratase/2-oxohepta-3-ene-1,7-dioic acid hydratase in catechol pathway